MMSPQQYAQVQLRCGPDLTVDTQAADSAQAQQDQRQDPGYVYRASSWRSRIQLQGMGLICCLAG